MKNNNIAFLIANIDNGGGTERVSLLLADYLCEKGYNVTFFSYQAKGKPFFKHNPKIRIIGFNRKGCFLNLISHLYPTNDQLLHFFIKLFRIDVIIDIDMGQAIYSSVAIQGTKCKQITWDHFNYFENKRKDSRKEGFECCIKSSTKLVVLTKKDKETYLKNENLDESFIEQIYNPLTIDECILPNIPKKKTVIAVGRLEEQKGFDMLLRIWSKIEKAHQDWELNIYGSGSEETKLNKLTTELGLKRAFLKGRTDDIKSKLAESSIFALSSRYEGFGLVLTEAEAVWLPIVSFDCPMGPSEIISHNKNGFLIEPNNLDDFADKLSLLIEDEQLREQFGKASFELSKRFNKEKIFAQWTELLNSL